MLLSQPYIAPLGFSADSNGKYAPSIHFCFLPFKIMSFWCTHSEIWKISALPQQFKHFSSLMLPNPSLLEHQITALQTYVFSLPSAERGKLDSWWTKYCRESYVQQKLVEICSLVTVTLSVLSVKRLQSSTFLWSDRNWTMSMWFHLNNYLFLTFFVNLVKFLQCDLSAQHCISLESLLKAFQQDTFYM